MTRLSIMVLFVMGLSFVPAVPANAGSISGKIRLANVSSSAASLAAGGKETVVVWLEGTHDSKPPDAPVKISQQNLQFSPEFAIVVAGQKIEMPNDDSVVHNVYSFTGASEFNLGLYAKGEVRTVVLDHAGIVDVFCSIHHQMHARIFVVPTKYFTNSMPGHSFSLTDVPPGKYVLKAWHERSRLIEKTIIVPSSGTVTADITLESGSQPAAVAKQ